MNERKPHGVQVEYGRVFPQERKDPRNPESRRTEIGRTKTTEAGFFVVVQSISFSTGPKRIRLELQDSGGFVRHLDITAELARDLEPLIRKAAELGAVR